jgi:hypothetical protein
VAALGLALAFIVSCSSDNGGGNPSKDNCIKTELEIKANTFDDVAKACNATRGEVLSQLPNKVGSCSKNELDFDRPIKDIMKDCGTDEITIVGGNSSSSGSTNNNGYSFSDTDVYVLVNYDGDSFTYATDEYGCANGGILKKSSYNNTMYYSINYSINNNILALIKYNGITRDTIDFKGTSNNIIGTWTRTKNKDCKDDWGITKLVFTQDTVAITYCYTDMHWNGEEHKNSEYPNSVWKYNIIDCDTYELLKGTEKVRIKRKRKSDNYIEATYNGKTCTYSNLNYSVPQRVKACSDAWREVQIQGGYLADYYSDFLLKDMREYWRECTENFPDGVFSGGARENLPSCRNNETP